MVSRPALDTRQGCFVPTARRVISAAPSSTFRCRETAGCVISNGSASCITVTSPWLSRARIARRVGSDSARKAAFRVGACECSYITYNLYNGYVMVKRGLVRAPLNHPRFRGGAPRAQRKASKGAPRLATTRQLSGAESRSPLFGSHLWRARLRRIDQLI